MALTDNNGALTTLDCTAEKGALLYNNFAFLGINKIIIDKEILG